MSNAESKFEGFVLAEYGSLKQEINLRCDSHLRVINWLMTLSVSTLGAFLILTPNDGNALLAQLVMDCDREAALLACFICNGYLLVVEILLMFWIYQLYQIFRMSDYIMCCAKVLGKRVSFPERDILFGWENVGAALDIGLFKRMIRRRATERLVMGIIGYTQPLFLYVAVFAGFLGSCACVLLLLGVEGVDGQAKVAAVGIVLALAYGFVLLGVAHWFVVRDHQRQCRHLRA